MTALTRGVLDAGQALSEEAHSLDILLAGLSEEQWRQPTRCTGWDVAALVAHLGQAIQALAMYAESPYSGPPLQLQPAAVAAAVDARARAAAEGQTPAALCLALLAAVDSTLAAAQRLGPEALLQTRFGQYRVDRYLAGRVVEACIHGLDLRAAIGAPQIPTCLALQLTVDWLEAALGEPRPAELGDDLAFVEAATGRRPHTDPRFPLLT